MIFKRKMLNLEFTDSAPVKHRAIYEGYKALCKM